MGKNYGIKLILNENISNGERNGEILRIYLLRHGETDWNKEERLQGHKDILMNEQGIMQIKEVASHIHSNSMEIDVIISSPLCRARMSAEIVAEEIGYFCKNIIIEPLFIERSFGNAEGLTKEERSDKSEEEYGMESVEMLCERAKKGITKYIERDEKQNILIVAHGAIIKAIIVALADGNIIYNDDSVDIRQGDIMCLEYEKGKKTKIWQNLIKQSEAG